MFSLSTSYDAVYELSPEECARVEPFLNNTYNNYSKDVAHMSILTARLHHMYYVGRGRNGSLIKIRHKTDLDSYRIVGYGFDSDEDKVIFTLRWS